MPFHLHNGPLIEPGIEGFSAAQPCYGEAVSGDGLFVETGRSDQKVMMLLVDVMGHGPVAAAVVATLGSHYLRLPVCQDRRPPELLAVLRVLLEPLWDEEGLFVAAQALLLDGQSKTVCAANAAVPEPQLGQPGGSWQAWPLAPGPLLGIPTSVLGPLYLEAKVVLPPDHLLLAFTDGVTEAGRGKSQQFQHGHLQRFLSGLPTGATPQHAVLDLHDALRTHVGAGWPEDDTTSAAVRAS